MNCPHWLLALTIPFSRSDRAHTYPAGVGAGCTEGLFPDELLRRRVSFGCRRAWGAVPTGVSPYQTRVRPSTRLGGPDSAGVIAPDRPLRPIVAGHPPIAADARSSGPVPSTALHPHTVWWHAVSHPAPRMPPGVRSSTGFPPRPGRQIGPPRERAPPADLLDLPNVTRVTKSDDSMMSCACCMAVTGQ